MVVLLLGLLVGAIDEIREEEAYGMVSDRMHNRRCMMKSES